MKLSITFFALLALLDQVTAEDSSASLRRELKKQKTGDATDSPYFAYTHAPTMQEIRPNTPTRMPTHVLGKSGCNTVKTSEDCAARSNECSWYSMTTCDYRVDPMTCNTFEYGCQERRQFCEFTQGSVLDQQMQCNSKGFPCSWNRGSETCVFTTAAPTKFNKLNTRCVDMCPGHTNNGICEDGGVDAASSDCYIGTDCADCGVRLVD